MTTLLGAVTAAGAALLGALTTGWLSLRERQFEARQSREAERREFLVARGEALFIHLTELDRHLIRRVDLIERLCHARIEREAYLAERAAAIAGFDEAGLARTDLSVRAFFPGLHPDLAALEQLFAALDTIDGVAAAREAPSGSVLYRISADAARLRREAAATSERLRGLLVGELAGLLGN